MEDLTLDKILEELQKNSQNPELIKDNKFYFQCDNDWYRVCMPNQKELSEANQHRNKITVQLLQKGKKEGFLLRKDLTTVLKENGVDIEAMDKEIERLKDQMIQVAITTAEKKDSEESIIEVLKAKTDEFEAQIRQIINTKINHLSSAIEFQAEDGWYKLLIANCTEKATNVEKTDWQKVWKTFADFQKDATNLPYICEAYFVKLIQNN
jgi:hypothetical protein